MPYFEHAGRRLYFEEHNSTGESRETVVLLHSFLCSTQMWRGQSAELASKYRVLVLDMRGHGQSGPATTPHTMYHLMEDAIALLDHCKVSSAFWAGLSIGGMIALRAAITHPARVLGLILLDTHAGPETLSTKAKYALLAQLVRKNGVSSVVGPISKLMFGKTSFASRKELVTEWIEKFKSVDVDSVLCVRKALVQRDDVRTKIQKLTIPALVMCGTEDKALPIKYSKEISDLIPNSKLIEVPRAGHLLSLEEPSLVYEAMHEFLARHGSNA